MKTIYLVHGWDGSSKDDWLPWATEAFRNLGYKVITPDMPNTEAPTIESWLAHLKSIAGDITEETYFIGHSIGCQAIMRYLETIDAKSGGALFVAGWFTLTNLEDAEAEEIARPWIETPINFGKVKNCLGKIVVILGNNDPFVPYEQTKRDFEEKLNAEVVTLVNSGHVTSNEGFGPFPKLIEVFEEFFLL